MKSEIKMHFQDGLKNILESAIKLNMPVLLVGETGVGKTGFVKHLAKEQGAELIRFNMTGQTGVDEFVGKMLVNEKGTYWQDGLLLEALKEGKWLVLDEINMALPEILSKLHSLLDDDRKVVVSENAGEVITPHANFRLFATMNPSEEYAGTKELNRAFLSRFPVIVEVGYTDKECQIIVERTGIEESIALNLVQFAKEIRHQKETGKLSTIASTRDLIQCGYLIKAGLDIPTAVQTSILNKFPKEEASALKEVIGVITGGKIKVKGIENDFETIEQISNYAIDMKKKADIALTENSELKREVIKLKATAVKPLAAFKEETKTVKGTTKAVKGAKFKVGDKVIGNALNLYTITKKGWTGTVVKVVGKDTIFVKEDSGYEKTSGYALESECFDLVESAKALFKFEIGADVVITNPRKTSLGTVAHVLKRRIYKGHIYYTISGFENNYFNEHELAIAK